MKRFLILFTLIVIFVVLASGCVSIGPTVKSYSGDKLQKPAVAVIKGWWIFLLLAYGGIDIYEIDGNFIGATKVEVLPGWHELVIRRHGFSLLSYYATPDMLTRAAFNFEAGHEYEIKFIEDKIVDVTTGATILKLPPFKDWREFSNRSGGQRFGSEIRLSTLIQPLPENHGSWSKEEVDTVIDAIVTVAKNHGLKKKGPAIELESHRGYSLSDKGFELCLNARFVYVEKNTYRYSPSLLIKKLNVQEQKGTIQVDIWYDSKESSIPESERLRVGQIWNELVGPLRDEFGERMIFGRLQ